MGFGGSVPSGPWWSPLVLPGGGGQGCRPIGFIDLPAVRCGIRRRFTVASLDLWVGPMDYLALFLITFAVNARHILMGTVLYLDLKDRSIPYQMWAVLTMTDAPFAMSQTEPDSARRVA